MYHGTIKFCIVCICLHGRKKRVLHVHFLTQFEANILQSAQFKNWQHIEMQLFYTKRVLYGTEKHNIILHIFIEEQKHLDYCWFLISSYEKKKKKKKERHKRKWCWCLNWRALLNLRYQLTIVQVCLSIQGCFLYGHYYPSYSNPRCCWTF